MKVTPASIPEVLILEPEVYADARGAFFESYNEKQFRQEIGLAASFVQDNQSESVKNVLRGLHYQVPHPQGKLVRVVQGEIFDVAVDLRKSSPTFARWTSISLSAADRKMVWIPDGFAHGFLVLSESATILYKTTDYYYPEHERCLLWHDATLNIEWPLAQGITPILSSKDSAGMSLADTDTYP